MSDEIPPIDPDLEGAPSSFFSTSGEREYLALEAEAAFYRLQKRSETQKYVIKWIAVATGIVVILGMAGMLVHLVHSVFWGPFVFVSPAFAVAMIVAPVVSITAITVSLFIGAFKKFDDKDLETIGNGAMGAAGMFKG